VTRARDPASPLRSTSAGVGKQAKPAAYSPARSMLPSRRMVGSVMSRSRRLGAELLPDGACAFRVWAPDAEFVELVLGDSPGRVLRLEPEGDGYHYGEWPDIAPGTRYRFRLPGGLLLPDPASRWQPDGVHGPSALVDPNFEWHDDDWTGLSLDHYVLYELHVGTFTDAGTFDAIIPRLDSLRDLGVTAIELMPVAQFPGARNWGYDGVFPFAVQNTYGGPDGLRRLVDACHDRGLAVVLDVVYNHLGPEGNCLAAYGPYFTDRYRTPWGVALNFDGACADAVRRYYIENALYWVTDFHIDALRLDAVHAIVDTSAYPFLEELAAAVHARARELGRQVYLFSESDANDPRLVLPPERGGVGLDALWSDDFHHALHALLTGERDGYYVDFGRIDDLATAFEAPFVYAGRYSAFRKRRHGRPAHGVTGAQVVVFAQNHDQVGNRARGERLAILVPPPALRLAAGVVLLSPSVPLLFMGEEYGETAPFPYFVSHSDPALLEMVRRGRQAEFGWRAHPPDPADEAVFRSAILNPSLADQPGHRELRALYRELLRARRETPALARLDRDRQEVLVAGESVLVSRRWHEDSHALAVFHFGSASASVGLALPAGLWRKRLDSEDRAWGGAGSPAPATIVADGTATATVPLAGDAFVLYVREPAPSS